jgi:hypothetical protein
VQRDDEQPPAWKPVLAAGVDLMTLPLTPEEGFVASRLDGVTDLHGLSVGTGLPRERVEAAVRKLAALGAVVGEEPRAEEAADPDEEVEDGPDLDDSAATGTHRQLYETTLRQLPAEERQARARTGEEPELSALCHDPLPAVVQALLENPLFGPVQARLVATHHRTGTGLEAVASRAALAADTGVRRALLRNPQLSAALLRRLQGGRRLLEQYKLAVSREVPEQTRKAARELLRSRFASADAEERVELILKTEGRCLTSLTGLPIDGKTSALLCGRPITSTLLAQNIARWASAPPALVAHLLKQEIVRRSPQLRLQLQRHPNAPTEPRR